MSIVEMNGGNPKVNKAEAFCTLLNRRLPRLDVRFSDLFSDFDASIRTYSRNTFGREITQGALSNVHGDWYEWLLAIAAWNCRISTQRTKMALPLPNVNRFDVASLYEEELYALVQDLREKVSQTDQSVRLITSNPDFVLINLADISLPHPSGITTSIQNITPSIISQITGAYAELEGKCSLSAICGYASVKTSLRPDRRLQLSHEGSLFKAIYAHLQTRNWILSPPGIKFYAISTEVKPQDLEAMKTIATHTITDVNVPPQRAVDALFEVNSMREALDIFEQLLA